MKALRSALSSAISLSILLASEAGAEVIQEITVTAQKREESAQDVPISISVFGRDTLRQLGIDSTIELAAFTPGLTIGQNTGEGDFPYISLRGVSIRDFADTNESPSAVYMDEFYKANLMGLDAQIFDVERAEVLRGPQGTLYGRNATGGLIHYITVKPSREFDAYTEFTVGERNRYKLEGAVGGPLTENLSARLSVLHHQFDGYVKNRFPGGEDGNALDANAIRAQLLFTPSEDVSLSLLLQGATNDNDAGNLFPSVPVIVDPVTGLAVRNPGGPGYNGYIEITPDDPRDTNSNRDVYLKTQQYTIIGRGEWTAGDYKFVAISGFERTSKDSQSDSDGTPYTLGTEVHPNAQQFSQELRLSGKSGRVNWLGGLYYFDYHVWGWQGRLLPLVVPDTPRPPVLYDLKSDSGAIFTNFDFELTPTVSLTTGLRYTIEDKEYSLDNRNFDLVFNQTTVGDLATMRDSNISFNIRTDWKPTDDVLIYAGVSRGHKAGTFNVGMTPIPFEAIPVRPEELTSYEIGAKTSWFGNRLVLNGSVFYYDYEDSQAYQYDGRTLSSTTFNRDAEVTGAELELHARPIDDLSLIMSVTYLDAKLLDVERPGPDFSGLPPEDMRMPLAPEWKISALGRYVWTLASGSRIALQGDLTYTSPQFFDAFNSPSHREPGYTVANARVSWYSADDRWEISAFVDNLTDKAYRTTAFDLAFLGFATDVYGKPRWAGATVGYKW
ncbi:MAG TPA: TonB-dependent receptor [Steroidobacteraceae bacterium]